MVFRLRLREECCDGRVRVSVVGEGEDRAEAAKDARGVLDDVTEVVEDVVEGGGVVVEETVEDPDEE